MFLLTQFYATKLSAQFFIQPCLVTLISLTRYAPLRQHLKCPITFLVASYFRSLCFYTPRRYSQTYPPLAASLQIIALNRLSRFWLQYGWGLAGAN